MYTTLLYIVVALQLQCSFKIYSIAAHKIRTYPLHCKMFFFLLFFSVHNSCYFNRHTSGPLLVRLKSFMESEDFFLSSTLFGHLFFLLLLWSYMMLHYCVVCFIHGSYTFNHSFMSVYIYLISTQGSSNQFLQILIFQLFFVVVKFIVPLLLCITYLCIVKSQSRIKCIAPLYTHHGI